MPAMTRWIVVLSLVAACGNESKKSQPPPPPPTAAADAAATTPSIDAAVPAGPITVVTDDDLGIEIMGISRTRPTALLTVHKENQNRNKPTIITTDYMTGERLDAVQHPTLHELAWSPWKPARTTKSKQPELLFDLAGKLAEIRAELALVAEKYEEVGAQATSMFDITRTHDSKQFVIEAGDLLYYLPDGGEPILLDHGAASSAVISPDDTRVAYDGCGSPCRDSTLRIATLAKLPASKEVRAVEIFDARPVWSADSRYVYIVTGSGSSKKVKKCFARVDATSFKATLFLCDENVEAVAYTRKADVLAAVVYVGAGKREVRTYALPDVKETSRTALESTPNSSSTRRR